MSDSATELRPVFDRWNRYVGNLKDGETIDDPICADCYEGDSEAEGAVALKVDRQFWHDACWRRHVTATMHGQPAPQPPRHFSQCTACGAPVYHVHTEAGARAIVDRDPRPDGWIAFALPGGIIRYLTKSGQDALPAGTPVYASHFSTCPARSDVKRMREKDKRA